MTHLTEEERQCLADGTVEATRTPAIEAHLDACAECRDDVARLRAMLALARGIRARADGEVPADDFAPIRARIERSKLVAMPGATAVRRRLRWQQAAFAAAAVAIIATAYLRTRPGVGTVAPPTIPPDEFSATSESTSAYQEQINDLLMDLQLRRSLLAPETAASIDRDLKVIDRAIGELNEALTRDPNNPALRQMLAASYRRKLDLLKRVGNAS
jgi:hypothetical protein